MNCTIISNNFAYVPADTTFPILAYIDLLLPYWKQMQSYPMIAVSGEQVVGYGTQTLSREWLVLLFDS